MDKFTEEVKIIFRDIEGDLHILVSNMFSELSNIAYVDARIFIEYLSSDLQNWLRDFKQGRIKQSDLIKNIKTVKYADSIVGLKKQRVSRERIEIFTQAILVLVTEKVLESVNLFGREKRVS